MAYGWDFPLYRLKVSQVLIKFYCNPQRARLPRSTEQARLGDGGTFQSTHPRGVRPSVFCKASASRCFNPRTHEGCDDLAFGGEGAERHVSIHAPTRGATSELVKPKRIIKFQSTHPRGVRHGSVYRKANLTTFQSTHPRGVRHTGAWKNVVTPMFQSTHPRGVRLVVAQDVNIARKFQSTHPRGVRLEQGKKKAPAGCFNPRTHEGCDFLCRR